MIYEHSYNYNYTYARDSTLFHNLIANYTGQLIKRPDEHREKIWTKYIGDDIRKNLLKSKVSDDFCECTIYII